MFSKVGFMTSEGLQAPSGSPVNTFDLPLGICWWWVKSQTRISRQALRQGLLGEAGVWGVVLCRQELGVVVIRALRRRYLALDLFPPCSELEVILSGPGRLVNKILAGFKTEIHPSQFWKP